MLRKVLYGLLIIILLLGGIGVFVYYKYLKPADLPVLAEDRAKIDLIPLPAHLSISGEDFVIPADFNAEIIGSPDDSIAKDAVIRFIHQLSKQVNKTFTPGKNVALSIRYDSVSHPVQKPVEDESYSLRVSADAMVLHATRPIGIIRGLETILQLVEIKNQQAIIPSVTIEDAPRYPWRGLMIDAGRHWISKASILRNLDAMEAVKLNVLHWHLSEYQAFRVESRLYPKLHENGSGGNYYTQAEIHEVISYARKRGIRVVPEFDMPGHATSWFVGYPELASAPGPYILDKKFGLLAPLMDPTREEVYTFIDAFIGEMASLFPDAYIHIGGDEVVPAQWNESPRIRAFMKERGMRDHHDLQNYFNKRIQVILAKHGRKMVGWDEILHPDLSNGIVVQAWRGQKPLFEAVRAGRQSILSAGWYLDHKLHAGKHYMVDPEVLPGAITIEPDSLHWKEYDIAINVSDNPMNAKMVLYGEEKSLRGLFSLLENMTGFENATLQDGHLNFLFASDYGEIKVEAMLEKDSIHGKMSLGFLSFPFEGVKRGGSDQAGTKPPVVQKIKPLTPQEKSLILGGEAALWTELVTDRNIDSRIWPRAAAIAEKLWTPAILTKDGKDMYRRLEIFSDYLINSKGAMHQLEYDEMIKDLTESKPIAPLKTLIDVLEEVKYYDRMTMYKNLTVETPMNEVVDAALPESMTAYHFNEAVEVFLKDTTHQLNRELIKSQLQSWQKQKVDFIGMAKGNQRLEKMIPISDALQEASSLAMTAFDTIVSGAGAKKAEKDQWVERMIVLDHSHEGVMIAVFPGFKQLVNRTKVY